MAIAYLSQGSNLGNRKKFISDSLVALSKLPSTEILDKSSIYESQAMSLDKNTTSPPYLNTIIKISTQVSAIELLAQLQEIEEKHGRKRKEKWGDRTLDIDIISFDGLIVKNSKLQLPHPHFQERNFILIPLLEIGVKQIAGIELEKLPCDRLGIKKICEAEDW